MRRTTVLVTGMVLAAIAVLFGRIMPVGWETIPAFAIGTVNGLFISYMAEKETKL